MSTPNHRRARKTSPLKPRPNRPQESLPAQEKLTAAPLRAQFSTPQLLVQFRKLLPVSLLASWLTLSPKAFYQRAFTPLLTLWYCLFQRLSHNHHLSHVVVDAGAGGADRLCPRDKKLSRQLQSEATTSFSDARQRLPLEILRQTLHHTATKLAASFQTALWFGHPVALCDGSTCRMAPYNDIVEAFPPHGFGNSHKTPHWCVARVVALFCLATGAVLDTAIASLKHSEQALIALILQRPWNNWILIADANFGVYSVARATVAAKAFLLARLTPVRAANLARLANGRLVPGLDLRFTWSPSRHDQCPQGLAPIPIPGRLIVARIQRPGFRPFNLCLFTMLLDAQKYPAAALVQLYGERWKVELDLRYLKTQMDLEYLDCRSAQMARKEWVAGLIAYNLIRWTMAAAAARAGLPVYRLSFTRARELLLDWFIRSAAHGPTVASWRRLLDRIAKACLPKRRKPRPNEPRATRQFNKGFAKLDGSRADARTKLVQTNAKS